ncbi:protein Skeletor, isoforms B/C isoform X1 [Euwallacea similis]|uniref:protein Skeletor, isoforms B/C isoform X1 n=1 Tax=Euwallacea similis TaxID=1736056 RepID=UPI00344FA4D5
MIRYLVEVVILSQVVVSKRHSEPHFGTKIGPFQVYARGIKGTVYAVDETTIFIKGFSYDGTGPDAFFWIGNSPRPSPEGIIIPYPEDYYERDPPILKAHNNTNIILRLPMGKRIRDIRWLSVWCRRFTVDFSEVFIPPNLEVPKPRVLPEFKRLAHGLRSDNISILDAKTFYIPNLHYDGEGPDAYFWIGNGTEPNPSGHKVPNQLNTYDPLKQYLGEDIEIQLPNPWNVYNIDWLSVWCVQYRINYGHVMIPKDLEVPPALGQTKISPSWWYNPTTTTLVPPGSTSCREFLDKRLQVKWVMKGDRVEITLSARIGEDKYVAFGLSGDNTKAQMVGADITVAYFDKNKGAFKAVDYYISHESQCDGKSGVCPDELIGGGNDVTVVHGERSDGLIAITYSRPLRTNEAINDRSIPENEPVQVIAAIGTLNSRMEPNIYQSMEDSTGSDIEINFGQLDDNQCTLSLDEIPSEDGILPWTPFKIIGENTFYVKMGPMGGSRGYSKITGIKSYGVCYYINDKLLPELTVERGQTYTFIVETGASSANPPRFHPLYITDSKEGGFDRYINAQSVQREEKTFAGVAYDIEGFPYPTAIGRYCEWTHKNFDMADECATFDDYMKTLRLQCDVGDPAYLNWTVPLDAPDLLYYQCYRHTNLGWKIHVVDPGYISQQNGDKVGRAAAITISISTIISVQSIFSLL